jgi:RecB family exonuclease
MPGRHYRLGPSSAKRWTECVGSLLGNQQDTPGRAAEYGTLIHAVFEEVFARLLDQNGHLVSLDVRAAMSSVRHQIDVRTLENRPEIVFDGEAFSMVEWAVEQVVKLMLTHNVYGVVRQEVEFEFAPLPPVRGEQLLGGTADVVIASPQKLIVIDLKTGRTPVPADDPQLVLYAMMAWHAFFPERAPAGVLTVVLQPNASPQVRQHEVTPQEMADLYRKVLATHEALQSIPDWTVFPGSTSLNPGTHCQFEAPGKLEMSMPAAELTTPQLIWFMERIPLLQSFCSDVTKTLLNRARVGEKIPGRKLVASFGHRKWSTKKAPQQAAADIATAAGAPSGDMFLTLSLKSPAQVEQALKKAGYPGANEVVAQFAESKCTGVKLVDVQAAGEEILPEMVQVFLQDNFSGDDDE